MESKSFALREVKMLDDATPGTFEAVVSVFGNVDSVGDRMVKGAFARTLQEKGNPPVVWSHEWQVPPIGAVESATETDEGLVVKGRLFIGADEGHAVAQQVYTAMKAGALKEFSFGYQTKGSRDVEEDGKTIREITDVDLFEVGPTLVGANSETRLVGVKSLERAVAAELAVKAGRVLSKSNETKLNEAHTAIGEVLAQVAETDEPPKKKAAGSVHVSITSSGSQIYKNLTATTADEDTQQADNPEPNSPPAEDEEAQARIGQLLLAHPHHTEEHTA